MDGTAGQEFRQLARMIPEQIVAAQVLQTPVLELEQRLLAEFERNPALTMEEVGVCPVCGASTTRIPCPVCGHSPAREEGVPVVMTEDWDAYRERRHDGDVLEPFASVAAHETLRDHLRAQWRCEDCGDAAPVGDYLIDCVDDDGRMAEPLIEVADRFRMSVPQVENVLRRLQTLDPPGVAARDLRECLLIQCSRFLPPISDGFTENNAQDDATVGGSGLAGSVAVPASLPVVENTLAALARRILCEAWEHLAARRFARIAALLETDEDCVEAAVGWIKARLAPFPGRAYRGPWDRLAPRAEPETAPDALIRWTPDGYVVEIVESRRFRLALDPAYRRTCDALGRRSGSAPPDFDHVRRSVQDARFLLDALAQRRRTLHQVLSAIVEAQGDYLRRGPAALKPLMQKTIAARVGVHESTVCRALADKMVRLPSGETVPTTCFFDAAAPAKEALHGLVSREDPCRPLSDARLAQLLTENGHPLARRTVAKYREALRIAPMEMRKTS